MSFNRVPQEFMKDVFISPHIFSDPENPQHGQYVNTQLRDDLYFASFEEVSRVEFSFFQGSEKEWLQIQQFQNCSTHDTWAQIVSHRWKRFRGKALHLEDNKMRMISCQDWKVAHHQGKNTTFNSYRVKIMQSQTDIFKHEIYPFTLYETLKDLLLN